MQQIPWEQALPIFLGTLPMLGLMGWNLMDVKALRSEIRAEFTQIRTELGNIRADISQIRTDLSRLTERVAILEERDRAKHPVLAK